MIPNKVALTFCQSCEEQIGNRFSASKSNLCTTGCKWDGSTSRERPIIVVTYWRREDPAPTPPIHHSFLEGYQPRGRT